VKAEYNYKQWDLSTTVSYSCLLLGDSAPKVRNRFVTDGPSFRVEGNDLGRHFLTFGLGAQRWLKADNSRKLFIQYSGDYGKNSNTQTAMIGCQFMF
jgi:hypothetical protein